MNDTVYLKLPGTLFDICRKFQLSRRGVHIYMYHRLFNRMCTTLRFNSALYCQFL